MKQNSKQWEYHVKECDVIKKLIDLGTGRGGFYGDVYWGAFGRDMYQIMPSLSNGDVINSVYDGFWDWHLTENEQWFDTPIQAACAYLKAYKKWVVTEHSKNPIPLPHN